MNTESPASVVLPTTVIEQIVQYLANQPYRQVAPLLNLIQQHTTAAPNADELRQLREKHEKAAIENTQAADKTNGAGDVEKSNGEV